MPHAVSIRSALTAYLATFLVFLIGGGGAAATPATPADPNEAAALTLQGKVITQHGQQPIVGARVVIPDQQRSTRTDSEGRFEFGGLAAGRYAIIVSAEDYATITREIALPSPVVEISLDLTFHDEPVVVTASPTPKDPLQIYQPTSVLDSHELERRGEASLGMTLQNEPGVATTSLGTAPARPVIRGLGGDRVLILEDGVRVGDLSSLSPDHAVAVNPLEAESIEIVRGPANLLYGSNAMGGVINVINEGVPSQRHERMTGSASMGAATNTQELAGQLSLTGSIGPISLTGGWARSDADEFHFDGGTAGNSQFDTTSYHGGVSWVGKDGFVGAGYRDYEGDWGIPVDEDGNLVPRGGRGVTLKMSQDSYKVVAQRTRPFAAFTAGRFQAVRREYKHTEFEKTGEAGTAFSNDTTEARADVTHKPVGGLKGTFGVWYLDGDLEAVGDEALVPEAKTRGAAAFFYEELGLEHVSLLFGGRYDSQTADPGSSGDDRSFSAFSGALGAIVNPKGAWSVAANVTRNFKAPSAEELFANGPHIATFTFEVGNPDLEEETSIGYDLSFRWRLERFGGELTAFRNDFQDFIFLEQTGTVDPNTGLPIAQYVQADSLFQGVEAHMDVDLREHLTLEFVGDQVRATNEDTDEPLPQIPPYRLGLGLNWEAERFGLGAEARYGAEKDRVAPGETPTDDYTIYNAFGHVQFTGGQVVHRVALRVENLTDRLYRNAVSLVKDIVPQPGRMARLTYSVLF